jgi:hypothetical protein
VLWTIVEVAISAAVIVAVAEVSHRFPRLGALLLTLPLVSHLAFVTEWTQQHDPLAISRLVRDADSDSAGIALLFCRWRLLNDCN